MLNQISDSALIKEYNKRFEIKTGKRILSAQDSARHFRSFYRKNRDVEQMVIMYLNGANKVIDTLLMFKGTITNASIYPREIIKKCLKLEAASIIISHNHPSGTNLPSQQDRNITNKIEKACETMNISLLDHIIIAKKNYYSFAEHREI